MVKAEQGSRPSDFDVQALMKIVNGDFSVGKGSAYLSLKQALEDSERVVNARYEAARARLRGEEVKAVPQFGGSELANELGNISPGVAKWLEAEQGKGRTKKQIRKALKDNNLQLSDDALSLLGFK